MGYRIASFNMKNLSLSTERDLDRIAAIIKDNQFDIVAMQEVLSEGRALSGIRLKDKRMQHSALERSLIGRLGKNWEVYWDDPKTSSKYYPYLGEDKRGEGYAFLWNSQKFELLKDAAGKTIYPRIFRDYKTDFGEGSLRLIRDPLYGRFKLKGTKVELRLITTHIISSKPDKMTKSFEGGAYSLRKHEFDILAGSIYSRISDDRKDVNITVPYTLILGDYNLNLKSSGVGLAQINEVAYYAPGGRPLSVWQPECRIIHTIQEKRTTIGDGDYANNFDHFSFDDRVYSLVTGSDAIDAVHQHVKSEDTTEEDKYNRFKTEVSDHIPIVIELNFR